MESLRNNRPQTCRVFVIPSMVHHGEQLSLHQCKKLTDLTPVETVLPIEQSPIYQTSISAHNAERKFSTPRTFCRICLSERGPFVRPCACTGSMAFVHDYCLNEWMEKSGKSKKCEICLHDYRIVGRKQKPIWQWSLPSFSAVLHVLFYVVMGALIAMTINGLFAKDSKNTWANLINACVLLAAVAKGLWIDIPAFVQYISMQKVRQFGESIVDV
uniref:RING-CH-type domain-containing protein n=1 Tax=Plectus sambesii TaxID=2011161 RepID=A0A914XGB7_9BILA